MPFCSSPGAGGGGVGVGWTWLSFSISKTKNDPTKREPGLSKKPVAIKLSPVIIGSQFQAFS